MKGASQNTKMEAAETLKVVLNQGETNLKALKKRPKFKDGDDGGDENGIQSILIRTVSNGFLVNFTYDDGEEVEEVYHDITEVLDSILLEYDE